MPNRRMSKWRRTSMFMPACERLRGFVSGREHCTRVANSREAPARGWRKRQSARPCQEDTYCTLHFENDHRIAERSTWIPLAGCLCSRERSLRTCDSGTSSCEPGRSAVCQLSSGSNTDHAAIASSGCVPGATTNRPCVPLTIAATAPAWPSPANSTAVHPSRRDRAATHAA
jgi:hypothetical protein